MLKLNNRCLLVVDDDKDTQVLFRLAFEFEGAEVLSAASAEEALALLEQRKPNVLLCDLGLPGMDGCELLQQIRTRKVRALKRLPAIAVTAYSDKQVQQQALAAGFHLFFTKPTDLSSLTTAIAEMTHDS
jgi:CheY-like chemotaxis protein